MAKDKKSPRSIAYDIGYGKPPRASQFKPGQSGNPAGRPKGSANLASVLAQMLREKVVINEGGVRKTITKREAAMKQLANQAAAGDLAAIKFLWLMIGYGEQASTDPQRETTGLAESDRKVMQTLMTRLSRIKTGGENA